MVLRPTHAGWRRIIATKCQQSLDEIDAEIAQIHARASWQDTEGAQLAQLKDEREAVVAWGMGQVDRLRAVGEQWFSEYWMINRDVDPRGRVGKTTVINETAAIGAPGCSCLVLAPGLVIILVLGALTFADVRYDLGVGGVSTGLVGFVVWWPLRWFFKHLYWRLSPYWEFTKE